MLQGAGVLADANHTCAQFNDYWMHVDNLTAQRKELYHVVDGDKSTALEYTGATFAAGNDLYLYRAPTTAKKMTMETMAPGVTTGSYVTPSIGWGISEHE